MQATWTIDGYVDLEDWRVSTNISKVLAARRAFRMAGAEFAVGADECGFGEGHGGEWGR